MGFARFVQKYDAFGNSIEYRGFGIDGKPIIGKRGLRQPDSLLQPTWAGY